MKRGKKSDPDSARAAANKAEPVAVNAYFQLHHHLKNQPIYVSDAVFLQLEKLFHVLQLQFEAIYAAQGVPNPLKDRLIDLMQKTNETGKKRTLTYVNAQIIPCGGPIDIDREEGTGGRSQYIGLSQYGSACQIVEHVVAFNDPERFDRDLLAAINKRDKMVAENRGRDLVDLRTPIDGFERAMLELYSLD